MIDYIVNNPSLLQTQLGDTGQLIQSIIIWVVYSIMIGFFIWFIERMDANKFFGKKIVLIGKKNRCCNARNVLILTDKYQCKKCKQTFPRTVT